MIDIRRFAKDLSDEGLEGVEFFDIIDSNMAAREVFEGLYGMVLDPHRYTFIVTGTFGKQFTSWLKDKPNAGHILFPGGIRNGVVQRPADWDIASGWERRCCFVDDSYYSGSTRATALKLLFNVGPDCPTYVAYDGSPAAVKPWLHSLYRWYPAGGADDSMRI